jgi:hypothetical protein
MREDRQPVREQIFLPSILLAYHKISRLEFISLSRYDGYYKGLMSLFQQPVVCGHLKQLFIAREKLL